MWQYGISMTAAKHFLYTLQIHEQIPDPAKPNMISFARYCQYA